MIMGAMTLGTSIAIMNNGIIEQLAKPMEIYRKPISRFVAQFVGSSPRNMIDLKTGIPGGEYLLRILKLSEHNVDSIGVRPECCQIVEPNRGEMNAVIDTIRPPVLIRL